MIRLAICYCADVGQFRRALESMFDRHGTIVMGILNVTPDSFYDGGQWQGATAQEHFARLVSEGACIIDIGAESTRPGASSVPADVQIQRLEPVLAHVNSRGSSVMVTVDTRDPAVARFALERGVHAINDVSCLADQRLAAEVARAHAGLILMHSRPEGSSQDSRYGDVVAEICSEWKVAQLRAVAEGVEPADVVFDPGIGFSKSPPVSFEVLRKTAQFGCLGVPIMIGASRKSFINWVHASPPEQRLGGTLAAHLFAVTQGARILRVHDVATTVQALQVQRELAIETYRNAGAGTILNAEGLC